ncbi:2-hydroxyacid dehydrogenase [Paenibacillus pinihumi]|uniref:2-hydroxyacid dehydrogenase n=1 Tax=Paenibacillus pinihumi TaxID=669462 RepID=UPI0004265393|nr:2-hydroxyacid dehydrogenase [Paenibacillus pinihumi]
MNVTPKRYCLLDSAIVLSKEAQARLNEGYNVEVFSPYNPKEEQLRNCDAMLLHSRLSRESLLKLSKCKYIGIRAHNTDYIDRQLAEEMGITVKGIPQVSQVSVAEHTFALIFAVTKQLKSSHNSIIAGNWRGELKPNYELSGKKLGVIGYGQIGRQVGSIGRALGMEVLIAGKTGEEKDGEMPLLQVIGESDILTLHLSNKDNKVFFDKEKINLMKPNAILINTSRGSLLDYESLKESLLAGRLFGAGLDVFPEEPLTDISLCELANVICSPHTAFYTEETLSAMGESLIRNLEIFYQS